VVLADGTASYAPIGTVFREGEWVLCHLCGRWFRSVVAHLRRHGWDHLAYRDAFGLERNEPLEGDRTRVLRAASMRDRRVHDPAVRAGCEIGRDWVRSGALTKAAAEAARGKPQPEQRRRKTLHTLASIDPAARAAGSRRRAEQRLRQAARRAAQRLGFADIGALVRDRVAAGASLAAISREAGLHKDWLCRHLSTVDPVVAAEVSTAPHRADARWAPVLARLGFADVAAYLTDRHLDRCHTVRWIVAETGLPRGTVEAALARHGIRRVPHAASRARRDERAAAVAARFGQPDIGSYLADRRGAGMSWQAIADECGQPQTWVRRRAGLAK
jgi:lambda repressor-like predicted transcriptional regulator